MLCIALNVGILLCYCECTSSALGLYLLLFRLLDRPAKPLISRIPPLRRAAPGLPGGQQAMPETLSPSLQLFAIHSKSMLTRPLTVITYDNNVPSLTLSTLFSPPSHAHIFIPYLWRIFTVKTAQSPIRFSFFLSLE